MSVRPAKTQISMGICPVRSESSRCAHWVAKDPSFLHADSEDSDQTGRMPRLIQVFARRTLTLLVLRCDLPPQTTVWNAIISKERYTNTFFLLHKSNEQNMISSPLWSISLYFGLSTLLRRDHVLVPDPLFASNLYCFRGLTQCETVKIWIVIACRELGV